MDSFPDYKCIFVVTPRSWGSKKILQEHPLKSYPVFVPPSFFLLLLLKSWVHPQKKNDKKVVEVLSCVVGLVC